MPYCLIPLQDGRFIVVNRKYKPLGETDGFVEYETHPSARRLVGLTEARIAKISCTGQPESDGRIYLYNDTQMPTGDAAAWSAYQARLHVLAQMTVE